MTTDTVLDTEVWHPATELVCEVTFDYLQGNPGPGARFRHAATFRRWRPDKPPTACGFEQIETTPAYELAQIFGG